MRELLLEAESEAKRVLIDLQLKPPIDIRMIAEYLGVEYHEKPYKRDVDGYYFRTMDGIPHAVINSHPGKPAGRKRFTAGHELYHHLKSLESTSPTIYYMDSIRTKTDPLERACDKFAACLIMPDEAVVELWDSINGGKTQRLAAIADMFRVTTVAMRVRLAETGILPAFKVGSFYR